MTTPSRPHSYPAFFAPYDPCNLPVQRCSVAREQASHRIIVMRLGALGDIVMSTPLLQAIRDAHPDAFITYIAEHSNTPAIEANPLVDEVVSWDGHYWKQLFPRRFDRRLTARKLLLVDWSAAVRRLRVDLRSREIDIFLSYQATEWYFLTRASGARNTVGVFDFFRRTFGPRRTAPHRYLYRRSYTYRDLPPHRTDQYLLGLSALGLAPASVTNKQMTLGYTSRDRDAAREFLRARGVDDGDEYVVIAPMTTWPSRVWPLERWAALVRQLGSDGRKILLVGTSRDNERAALTTLAAALPPGAAVIASGALTFRELAAAIDGASLVVSSDSGSMHMAAALGTPYVALFGPTDPDWFAPLAGGGRILFHKVPCGPCDKVHCQFAGTDGEQRCLRLITVADVRAACDALLLSPGARAAAPEHAYAQT